MENGYRRYQELEESGAFDDPYYKLNRRISAARNLVSKLQTEFEYIRGDISQLEIVGNTALTKTYSIQTDLDELSSEISQLKLLLPKKEKKSKDEPYNGENQVPGFPIIDHNNKGVLVQAPDGDTQFMSHAEYRDFYNNIKKQNYGV